MTELRELTNIERLLVLNPVPRGCICEVASNSFRKTERSRLLSGIVFHFRGETVRSEEKVSVQVLQGHQGGARELPSEAANSQSRGSRKQ